MTAQLNVHNVVKERQNRKFQQLYMLKAVSDDLILSPEWMKNDSKDTNFSKGKWVYQFVITPVEFTGDVCVKRGLDFAQTRKELS